MPVVAFGAEIELTKGLALGPQMRWYIVSVDSACLNRTRQVQTFDPFTGQPVFDPNTGQPVTTTATTTDCAQSLSDVSVPDIVFVGAGLTYRIGI
jgi:hypothetical protein